MAQYFRHEINEAFITFCYISSGKDMAAFGKVIAGHLEKLDDFILVLSKLARGARVPLEYISHSDRHRNKSVLVTTDRHEWYAPPQIYTRDGITRLWTTKPAIDSSSPMLSFPTLHTGQSQIDSCSNIGEPGLIDHNYQTGMETVADGYVKMQTDEETPVDGDDLNSEQNMGVSL